MAFRSRVPRPNPPRHVLPVPRFSSLSPHPRNCPPFLVQRPTRIIVVAAVYIYIYISRERENRYLFTSSRNLSLSFCSTPSSLFFYLFHSLRSLAPFVPSKGGGSRVEEGSLSFFSYPSSLHLSYPVRLCFLRSSLSLLSSAPPSLSASLTLSKLSAFASRTGTPGFLHLARSIPANEA